MVLWEFVEGNDYPWPDFDTWRKCYGHERFYDWQKSVKVDLEPSKTWDWTKGRVRERPAMEQLQMAGKKEGETQHAGHEGHWP